MVKYNVIPTEQFEKDIKYLIKKYRRIDDDVDDVVAQLEQGFFLGELVNNLSLPPNHKAYKCRIKNTSSKKGKSGGFRFIYYVVTDNYEIYLITIFSKTEIGNLDNSTIRKYITKTLREKQKYCILQTPIQLGVFLCLKLREE
ncbi:MAG TPA: type II toxin-antitoxin system RelE/ParE family toxin [Gelria sp.]|jgi:mRNA-degrading endonuclease RelE of RelBE toxin-antitoxin system|nr:type II toxin-antitoxin system RelE/ParE family toxin [Gelria sp.]